jgi:hypothetical protein
MDDILAEPAAIAAQSAPLHASWCRQHREARRSRTVTLFVLQSKTGGGKEKNKIKRHKLFQ